MCGLYSEMAELRLRVVPQFPSGTEERAKRERARNPTRERRKGVEGEKIEGLPLPRRVSPFSRGVIFKCALILFALLSLRENERLLVV